MALISKLKELLGMNGGQPSGGTTVAVEREPDPATERAVKEPTSAPDEPGPPAEPSAGADEPVDSLSGIGAAYAERLADAGIETVADLAAADATALAEATDLGEGRLEGWIEQANDR